MTQAVFVEPHRIPVWPDPVLKPHGHPAILVTRFPDTERYHPQLIETILQLERSGRFANRTRSCGMKVQDIPQWNSPAADLVHARALALYCRALGRAQAVAGGCWANLYRRGDYCMPHSHIRCEASVVYCVDPGDEDAKRPLSGAFAFVDPRLESCCKTEPGRMTEPLFVPMVPGLMVIFPSQTVHCVNPYHGRRPRITMSWNLSDRLVPGQPFAPHNAARGHRT